MDDASVPADHAAPPASRTDVEAPRDPASPDRAGGPDLTELGERLLALGATDPVRRSALEELLNTRGEALVATSVGTPQQPDRGSLLAAVVDDRPFLLDTLLVAVRRAGHTPRAVDHPVLPREGEAGIDADADGISDALQSEHGPETLVELSGHDAGAQLPGMPVSPRAAAVAAMVVELDTRLDPVSLVALEDHARRGLLAATCVVDDHAQALAAINSAAAADGVDPEAAQLLYWLADNRMILLGVATHTIAADGTYGPEYGGLGLLSPTASDGGKRSWVGPVEDGGDALEVEPPALASLDPLRAGASLAVGPVGSRSPVHRGTRPQELLLPARDADGMLIGVARVLYLLTHRAETEPASAVPVLRQRLTAALEQAGLRAGSHDHKRMVALYDAMPKDELLAIGTSELVAMLRALMAVGAEEVMVRSRTHLDQRTASIVIAIPRDRYVPALRERLEALVAARYDTDDTVAHEVIGDEAHVQLHVVVHDPKGLRPVDERELEAAVSAMARTWLTSLRDALIDREGDEPGRLLAAHWGPRIPEQYRAVVDPVSAVDDVLALDHLHRSGEPSFVALRQEDGPTGTVTRVALLSRKKKAELSRVIMILEDLGLTVIEERPTRVTGGGEELWIQDFGVTGPGGEPLDLDVCGDRVAACVSAVWRGEAESDALHRLIVTTDLDHERLEVLRAYRRYRSRVGSRYTERFQNQVIVEHPQTTAALIRLFEQRFDPSRPSDPAAEQALRDEIVAYVDEVESLDHDRILRNQLGLIDATVRTNHYVPGAKTLAIKLRAADVPALPQPAPLWEVYVYAPHMEGIHLRGGMIARGGLRWSDREDFRTEVLGLMRAQMVKNSVIVPAGAKGGFRLRQTPSDPAELRTAVEAAYVDYVGALLELTDSREGGEVIHPAHVTVRDGDDPYLVVAADKGTATFSDTANRVAHQRGFWLDDAFASGGSRGYDHKVLGITARGAWESVKRHFRERGLDPEVDPISVVGIGDMSGDVFGNGLLRSKSLRLIGAYDHRHIFIDPVPADAEASFNERQRLFDTPRSSWDDYDRALISPGGGVFPRTLKSIPLTDEMRACLGVDDERLAPSDLIRAVLRAPVDLLWNGGIGTVVKASTETDADAQDRSSDSIRVDARDLRASVVGEGGNLGFTHRARIEYAKAGGAINADFIDNSAGVDCSDHEVNLKILLGEAIRRGDLDMDGRDALLEQATDEVCDHVLATSYRQARILTEEQRRSPGRMAAYEELMVALEEQAGLIRADHDLPTSDQMTERHATGDDGMTRPELSVLLSLAKIAVTEQLLDSPLVDDRALEGDLLAYFPKPVVERFGYLAWEHPLRRELLAMLAANDVVDTMGESFVFRRAAEFGASASAVVRAFLIARDVCDAPGLISQIELLDVDPETRWSLSAVVQDAVRQVSRWYLRNDVTADDDLRATVDAHRDAARALIAGSAQQFGPEELESERSQGQLSSATAEVDAWETAGVPHDLAVAVARCRLLPFAPYLAGVSARTGGSVPALVEAVGALRRSLPLDVLQGLISSLPAGTRVARWANQALRDDYLAAVARLAGLAIADDSASDPQAAVQSGIERRQSGVRRLQVLVREASLSQHTQVAGTTLAVRQLRELAGWMTRRRSRAVKDVAESDGAGGS
ncbi:MAG: NAD-glutamate dehydrogenase [Solirubrobacteraceae bacterium]|nr:NAD-glutamate dehydrogenase [Solirubrobacteraceae bacterium]